MTRLDELQKKYPQLLREILVRWDAMRYGVNDSEVLDKVWDWQIAGSGGYQTMDLGGVTLKGIAAKRPSAVRPGRVMKPSNAYMSNALGFRILRSLASPYEIKELGEGKFALFEGEEKVEDIYFIGPKPRNEEAVTSKGTRVSTLVSGNGYCFSVNPVRHCEYFPHGEQCRFCNFNATFDDARSVGSALPTALNLEDTAEAFKIVASNTRLVEGYIVNGGFRTREAEAKVHLNFAERIAGAASYKPHLVCTVQANNRRVWQRLKDAGVDALRMQLEVWDRDMFAQVCPGKAKRDGFEGWLDSIQEAVDVFGVGQIGATFCGGVSLMPSNGHKTWQESRDSLIEGMRWMIKNGVFPVFMPLRLGAGSVYGDDASNEAKLPPTDYYLDAALAHHEAMMEYGLYQKLDKLIYCPLDCSISSYDAEIGAIALAGSMANWAAEAVPDEANWLKEFTSSLAAR